MPTWSWSIRFARRYQRGCSAASGLGSQACHQQGSGCGPADRSQLRPGTRGNGLGDVDADGQHSPEEIERSVEPVRSGAVDVAWAPVSWGRRSACRCRRGRASSWACCLPGCFPRSGSRTPITAYGPSRYASQRLCITQNRMAHASETPRPDQGTQAALRRGAGDNPVLCRDNGQGTKFLECPADRRPTGHGEDGGMNLFQWLTLTVVAAVLAVEFLGRAESPLDGSRGCSASLYGPPRPRRSWFPESLKPSRFASASVGEPISSSIWWSWRSCGARSILTPVSSGCSDSLPKWCDTWRLRCPAWPAS